MVCRCSDSGLAERFPGNNSHNTLCYIPGMLKWRALLAEGGSMDAAFEHWEWWQCGLLHLTLIYLQKYNEMTKTPFMWSCTSALLCSCSLSFCLCFVSAQIIWGSAQQVRKNNKKKIKWETGGGKLLFCHLNYCLYKFSLPQIINLSKQPRLKLASRTCHRRRVGSRSSPRINLRTTTFLASCN